MHFWSRASAPRWNTKALPFSITSCLQFKPVTNFQLVKNNSKSFPLCLQLCSINSRALFSYFNISETDCVKLSGIWQLLASRHQSSYCRWCLGMHSFCLSSCSYHVTSSDGCLMAIFPCQTDCLLKYQNYAMIHHWTKKLCVHKGRETE